MIRAVIFFPFHTVCFPHLMVQKEAPLLVKKIATVNLLHWLKTVQSTSALNGTTEFLRYSGPLETNAEAIPFPKAFTNKSNNRGIEALTWLPGGCLLAIPEQVAKPTSQTKEQLIEAFLWDQFSWRSLYLRPNGNFLPTGLSVTPNGDLLLLERSFSLFDGFKANLRIFPAQQIQPGKIMEGRVLADFGSHHVIDNMEGISSRLGANGETLVYLLSDDNLNFTQDTLLLMFEINEQRKPADEIRTAGCSKNKSAYSAALETKAF